MHSLLLAICGIGILIIAAVLLRALRAESDVRAARYGAGLFPASDGIGSLRYRLYVPEDAPAQSLPLVLYLHGGGSRGTNNTSQLELGPLVMAEADFQTRHPSFVLVPQCPPGVQFVNHGMEQAPYTNYQHAGIPESPEARMIMELIDVLCQQHPIDPDRIYLTGFSMGASGLWDLVFRYPKRFAAAIPLNGVTDPGQAERIQHLPIWLFHGGQDAVSPVSNSRAMVAALRRYDSTVRFTEYPELGHDIQEATYSQMPIFDWLFAHHRAREPVDDSRSSQSPETR